MLKAMPAVWIRSCLLTDYGTVSIWVRLSPLSLGSIPGEGRERPAQPCSCGHLRAAQVGSFPPFRRSSPRPGVCIKPFPPAPYLAHNRIRVRTRTELRFRGWAAISPDDAARQSGIRVPPFRSLTSLAAPDPHRPGRGAVLKGETSRHEISRPISRGRASIAAGYQAGVILRGF
jgi:hypothetical protein